MRRAGIFGGGLEARKRAIKREQRVRTVACRVAVTTGDGILYQYWVKREMCKRKSKRTIVLA